MNTSIKGKKFLERLNKRLYRGFKLDAGKDTELFKEFSPELREEGFINGLEKYYRQIEFAVGLSYGDLSDAQYVEKTAGNRNKGIKIKKIQSCNSHTG